MNKIMILFTILVLFQTGCSQISNSDNTSATSVDSYVACGCGCCGGAEPKVECIYHSNGDDINKIIENDILVSQAEGCRYAGCSQGVKYTYCD